MPDNTPGTVTGGAVATPAIAGLAFKINESAMIPVEAGQAVAKGWPASIGGKPLGVTWHWTVTHDLLVCRQVLGGRNAERKGEASAHYGIGRSFKEGVDRYVSLENRSFHAGIGQTLQFDGKALSSPDFKGSRSTIGVETVSIGAVDRSKAKPDFIRTAGPRGEPLFVQPWTEEQIAMMIAIGVEIVTRFPHIQPRHHHGHHDICPDRKIDVAGFPFARVLRGIYPKLEIPDVWTPLLTARQRQRALIALGFNLGASGADGDFGQKSRDALTLFQKQNGLVANTRWSTFVNWKLHDVFKAKGMDLAKVTGAAD